MSKQFTMFKFKKQLQFQSHAWQMQVTFPDGIDSPGFESKDSILGDMHNILMALRRHGFYDY